MILILIVIFIAFIGMVAIESAKVIGILFLLGIPFLALVGFMKGCMMTPEDDETPPNE